MKAVIGKDIHAAAELLRNGDLVAIPTETVYGLAADTVREGYRVRFVSDVLRRLGDGEDWDSFFERATGKALALTFRFDPESDDLRRVAAEPIPEIALIDCPDRAAWSELMWELNQPDADGTQRHTVLIQDQRDMVRLQRAMMMKQVIELNSDDDVLKVVASAFEEGVAYKWIDFPQPNYASSSADGRRHRFMVRPLRADANEKTLRSAPRGGPTSPGRSDPSVARADPRPTQAKRRLWLTRSWPSKFEGQVTTMRKRMSSWLSPVPP